MRKNTAILFITAAALTMAACGASDTAKENSAASSASSQAEASSSAEASSASETSSSADAAKATGEAITTDYGTVVLGQYKGLASTQTVTEITDDDVDSEISSLQSQYSTYEEREDGAQSGDIVYAYFTGTNADGDVIIDNSEATAEEYAASDAAEDSEEAAESEETEESEDTDDAIEIEGSEETSEAEPYEIYLGYQEYGEEFDEKLTGAKAGDELKFTVEYPEDDDYFPGETIDFDVKVDYVEMTVTPELDDSFIKDTLGYDSEDDMREQIREELETEAIGTALEETKEDLIAQVIQNSEITDYDQDYYDEQYEQIESYYEEYMNMFGYEDMETFLEDMGTSEDDIKDQALDTVYRTIVVEAITQQEGLALSDEEYQSEIETFAATYGFDDTDEFVETYGEDTIKSVINDTTVLDFLYDNAEITETEAEDTDLDDYLTYDVSETEEDQKD